MDHSPQTIARRVIDAAIGNGRPYAVFSGRSPEFMPADGKRFAKVSGNPERMAHLVGVFDAGSAVDAIAAALEEAQG